VAGALRAPPPHTDIKEILSIYCIYVCNTVDAAYARVMLEGGRGGYNI